MRAHLSILFLAGGLLLGCGEPGSTYQIIDYGSNQAPTSSSSGMAVDPCAQWTDTRCPCPKGPVGYDVGNVADWDLAWQGYPDGDTTTPETVRMIDYYDCDGSRGINAVVVIVSAVWCPICNTEADGYSPMLADWKKQGIELHTQVDQDGAGKPASLEIALGWKTQHGLADSTVVAAPNGSFKPFKVHFWPFGVLLDPRTFTIVQSGFWDEGALATLAQKNGAMP